MSASNFFRRAFSLLWAAAICPPATLLLFTSVTTRGLLFAIAALLLGIAPLSVWLKPERRWLRRSGWMAIGAWALITIWLAWVSPYGRPWPNARVQNRYSDQGWHYQRFALGSLLPEIDQLLMGVPLIPLADRLFTFRQASAMCQLTKPLYAEMEADADFHALGSVMPDVYAHLAGGPANRGHYFLYTPPNLDRSRPAPALVFLHGSGGNFKAYTWLLSRVADEHGMVLIVPSNGMGTWDRTHGIPSVTAALDDASRIVALDANEIHLAGLSNGGLGVSRLAACAAGSRFRSLIFLSPVFDQSDLMSENFSRQWSEKKVLIITGETDNRIPIEYVKRCAAAIRSAGVSVEMDTYPDADHLLIFSHRDRLLAQLSGWLAPARRQP